MTHVLENCLSIPLRGAALFAEFSPFEWSQSLLAIGLRSSVAVYSIDFSSTDNETKCKDITFDLVWECHVANEPVCIAWSPLSTLRTEEKCLQLMIGTVSYSVIQLTSDLKNENLLKEVSAHKDSVNSVAYSGDCDEILAASTGDDLLVKVWQCSSNQLAAKFRLTSPGVIVKFHPEDADIMLVGEKGGSLRLYSIGKGCVKRALRNPCLTYADWSIADPSLLLASSPQGLFVWNVTDHQPSPIVIKLGEGEFVTKVSCCPFASDVVATISGPNTLTVQCLPTNKAYVALHVKAIGGISWHLRFPYLAVTSESKLILLRNKNL